MPAPVDANVGRLTSAFSIDGLVGARCLAFGPDGFAGELRLPGGQAVLRVVVPAHGAIEIIDGSETGRLAGPIGELSDWTAMRPPVPFSPGYGILERPRE